MIDPFKLDPSEMFNTLPPLSASDLSSRSGFQKKYKYNCRIFDIQNPNDKEEFEELMSRFVNQDSKVSLHHEQNTFTKDGDYYTVIRWISEE